MITHLVLFSPRADLDAAGRDHLTRAFETAMSAIPTVRGVRLGRRLRHAAGYERSSGNAQYVALIEFDDLAGLQEYLRHPAHEALGRLFRESLHAEVYDFDTGGVEGVTPGARGSG